MNFDVMRILRDTRGSGGAERPACRHASFIASLQELFPNLFSVSTLHSHASVHLPYSAIAPPSATLCKDWSQMHVS